MSAYWARSVASRASRRRFRSSQRWAVVAANEACSAEKRISSRAARRFARLAAASRVAAFRRSAWRLLAASRASKTASFPSTSGRRRPSTSRRSKRSSSAALPAALASRSRFSTSLRFHCLAAFFCAAGGAPPAMLFGAITAPASVTAFFRPCSYTRARASSRVSQITHPPNAKSTATPRSIIPRSSFDVTTTSTARRLPPWGVCFSSVARILSFSRDAASSLLLLSPPTPKYGRLLIPRKKEEEPPCCRRRFAPRRASRGKNVADPRRRSRRKRMHSTAVSCVSTMIAST
mmetsp:Transcript_22994/g.73968  ORF Transcript_22994/g.73968 Transcript_22994/m.73968 type:complete len:291 (-) Transcript_22994:846-1718(-)